MVHRVTSNDNEWQRMTTSGTTNDNKWYNEWQRVTTSDIEWYNEWQRVIQRVTMSSTARDNEWQRIAKNDNGWPRMTASIDKKDWIRISVSKIEWLYVSKETQGQSGRPIRFPNNFTQFSMQYVTTRISRSQMFFEIGVLKVCNIHRETPVLESLFLVKLQAWRPINLLRRDSNTDVFLWILRTFWEFKEHHRWLLLYLKFTGNLII